MFYAHDAGFNLYFLSEERTEHDRNLLADAPSRAPSTLTARTGADPGFAGARPGASGDGDRARPAVVVYGRKFSFVAASLAGSGSPGVLAGPLARAGFWVLQPTWFRLIDNTVQFGFKEEWVSNE